MVRQGAAPKRSIKKSRKTLTLRVRCRPGGMTAHNGNFLAHAFLQWLQKPFLDCAGYGNFAQTYDARSFDCQSHQQVRAVGAERAPDLDGDQWPDRNGQGRLGTWMVRHECRARSEGCSGRPWRARYFGLAQITRVRSAILRATRVESSRSPVRSAMSTFSPTRSTTRFVTRKSNVIRGWRAKNPAMRDQDDRPPEPGARALANVRAATSAPKRSRIPPPRWHRESRVSA